MIRAYVLASVCAVAACGGGGDNQPPGDARPDADNGTCGAELRFTGEHIDWNSGTKFCGVFGAQFTVRGTGTTSSTAPNGRFDTCVPNQDVTLVDIAPPTELSRCNETGELYTLPAVAVVRKDVLEAGFVWSSRAFTPNQLPSNGTGGNVHVFVHIVGEPRKVLFQPTGHQPAQVFANNQWTAVGSGVDPVGNDIVFPYIETSGSDITAQIELEGSTMPPFKFPVKENNELVLVTLLSN